MKFSPVDTDARAKLDMRSGDTVRVTQKIKEGEKTRLQAFEGLVIGRKHGVEAGGTFTVRRVVSGVGVEKVFPLYSPMIDSIEVIRRSHTRRAKLYYIRKKTAKEIRKKMKGFAEFVPARDEKIIPESVAETTEEPTKSEE